MRDIVFFWRNNNFPLYFINASSQSVLCTLVHYSKLINNLQRNRNINMILLLTMKPIKTNKWSVRWIPMSRKPYLNNQISKEVCLLHSWDGIAVPLKIWAKLSGEGLNMTVFIPWKQKSSGALIQNQPIAQWNRSQKGQKRQCVRADTLVGWDAEKVNSSLV